MADKKIIIIDANSLIHRAFHALPPLTTKDGTVVNALYGFATILLKALKDFKPDYIACCFDVDRDTFRKQEFEGYKAHRKEQPGELYQQFPLIKELLEAFNIVVYEKKGYEADDLLGTISALVKEKHSQVKNVIVSGDLDTLQLIDKQTEVYTLRRGISDTIVYDSQAVEERFGFGPDKMVDYKALRGDPSDNIPGVKGIGEKTAQELIKNFGSLEKIYEFLEKNDFELAGGDKRIKPAVLKKLQQYKDQAYLSKKLATIVRDVKIDFNLDEVRVKAFDTERVVGLFRAWNFNSLIAKIPNAEKMMREKQGTLFSQNTEQIKPVSLVDRQDLQIDGKDFEMKKGYELIDGQKKFDHFLSQLKKQKEFVFDTETDGLNPFRSQLLGISFSWQATEAWYVPVASGFCGQELRDVFGNEKIKKIGHNLKFDFEVLTQFGFEVNGLYFDTMIASYLLNPGTRQHALDNLAFSELGYRMQSIEELAGEKNKSKIDLSKIETKKVANYSCEDADITWQLYLKLSQKLDEATIEGVLTKIEVPLVPVLAVMEKHGVKLDGEFLQKMSSELAGRLKKIEKKIFAITGHKFNVASPIQLKAVLFDELGISTAGLTRTKTGISTAAGELDKLRGRHQIVDLITDFRELSKLKNTYLEPLPKLVDEQNRLHTSFNQVVTATGRLSSSDPNLQNIPIRSEIGREIRKAFVAARGFLLVAADYSQIELRVVASLSGDKKMLKAFNKGQDIHRQTAAEIFEIDEKQVTTEQRRQAKTVNFGVLYGLGARGLAQGTGMSYEQATDFIDRYFEVYEGIKNYIEETIALTRELGYTETLFGRRRYLPEINANHPQLRSAAERMAVNHPVQGTAADVMKLAMINLNEKIKKEFVSGEVRMLLQVHDELVFEVKDEIVDYATKIIKREMESVYKLKAPIEVEVGVGRSWGEAK